jgi:hypothetical protein
MSMEIITSRCSKSIDADATSRLLGRWTASRG